LLDKGLVNTHSRGNGYTDYNRRTVGHGVFNAGRLAVIKGVEAGSKISTVTLRVVGGDEKGSLKFETAKYGRESQGTRTREILRWQGPAAIANGRPVLSSERAPYKNKTVTVTQVIKIWS
jgi:hypothetical protein